MTTDELFEFAKKLKEGHPDTMVMLRDDRCHSYDKADEINMHTENGNDGEVVVIDLPKKEYGSKSEEFKKANRYAKEVFDLDTCNKAYVACGNYVSSIGYAGGDSDVASCSFLRGALWLELMNNGKSDTESKTYELTLDLLEKIGFKLDMTESMDYYVITRRLKKDSSRYTVFVDSCTDEPMTYLYPKDKPIKLSLEVFWFHPLSIHTLNELLAFARASKCDDLVDDIERLFGDMAVSESNNAIIKSLAYEESDNGKLGKIRKLFFKRKK